METVRVKGDEEQACSSGAPGRCEVQASAGRPCLLAAQSSAEWPESVSALRLLSFDRQPLAKASKEVDFCQAREMASSR